MQLKYDNTIKILKECNEEFAQFMHNMIRTYITVPGTYSDELAGIVVLRTGDVTLKNATVNGDLVAGDHLTIYQMGCNDFLRDCHSHF